MEVKRVGLTETFYREGTSKRGDDILLKKERELTRVDAERLGNITNHKEDGVEMLREREKLQTLSDNAPFGMVLIDNYGQFTYVNNKFTTLFGYDQVDTPDGETWFRRAFPETKQRHAVIAAWIEEFRDRKPGQRNPRVFTVTCKNGEQRVVNFIVSVLLHGGYLMVCEDITKTRRIESQLYQAQKMESIGTLAGGIAHDFNNILTSLTGFAALMQMQMDKFDPLRPYVDQILSVALKASELTKSLMTFSRPQQVYLAPLDINKTIESTNKLLMGFLTEDIEVVISLTGDETVVRANKSQIEQILFNLVANSRDAMPKGGRLTIESAIVDIDDEFIRSQGFGVRGRHVVMRISDTGTGMDDVTKKKLFDPFFTTKEVGRGTGLGLATVYGIVNQHNGYIDIDSQLNHGTTFSIYLPASTTRIKDEQGPRSVIKTGSETILIAEDNEEVRRFMRVALERHGYRTIMAADGEDAIEKFKEHRGIELILADAVMPKKNGREVYEQIHGMDPRVKFLFVSGYNRDIVLSKGIDDERFNFIAKPLFLDSLLEKVREVLDKQ